MSEVLLIADGISLPIRLLPCPTAGLLLRLLPFTGTARFWGRLVRIEMPLEAYLEPPPVLLPEPGDVLWSPDHDDLFIPYGATPISRAGEIRLPSPVTRIGRLQADPQALREIVDGAMIRLAPTVPARPKPRSRGLADPRRGKGRWLG